MLVLFGTLGFHPEKFLAAIPIAGAPIGEAKIYSGTVPEAPERRMSQRAIEQVAATLRAMGIRYSHHEFTSPWEFGEILHTFLEDLTLFPAEETIFNLTGGPKTMTVAATIACLMHGIRVIYVPEELRGSGTPIELPLLRIQYGQVLGESQRRFLRTVRDRAPKNLDELAKILRLRNATISYHVARLEKLGALVLATDPRDKTVRIPRLTKTGEIMLDAEEILSRRQGQTV